MSPFLGMAVTAQPPWSPPGLSFPRQRRGGLLPASPSAQSRRTLSCPPRCAPVRADWCRCPAPRSAPRTEYWSVRNVAFSEPSRATVTSARVTLIGIGSRCRRCPRSSRRSEQILVCVVERKCVVVDADISDGQCCANVGKRSQRDAIGHTKTVYRHIVSEFDR